jgi:hypothetical protein
MERAIQQRLVGDGFLPEGVFAEAWDIRKKESGSR